VKIKMHMLVNRFFAANSRFARGSKSVGCIEQNQVLALDTFRRGTDRLVYPRVSAKRQRIIVACKLESFTRAGPIRLCQQTFSPMKLDPSEPGIEPRGLLEKFRCFGEFFPRQRLHCVCIKLVELRAVAF